MHVQFPQGMHVWVTGNGVTSKKYVMNHLPLIKKASAREIHFKMLSFFFPQGQVIQADPN
tara:strand:- start:128 stop:307 length:180 start_codon:yes stop_codon:yes gene_type:complete